DSRGMVPTKDEDIRHRWSEYFLKLFNQERRSETTSEEANPMEDPPSSNNGMCP
ncbi:hypothetical protein Tco_0476629, partial [Tanacetum coccineum]